MDNFLIQLSENILLKARLGEDTSMLRRELHYLKDKKLESFLYNDELKSIFWCNIYNGFVLIMAKENSKTISIFKYKRIKIAHSILSLDDIEYKILRMNNYKPLHKYIYYLFSPRFIKNAAIKKGDSKFISSLDRTPLYTSHSVN
ncbi:DUF547 domain-containing protein [Flavobacterium sp. WC2430]|uniref:DUF547 domain-containing protein n=1 Tax=Flavobacterium sp. WC2430 TaxID=3234137 RepID=UPI003467C6E5